MWIEIENLSISNDSKTIFENASFHADNKLVVIYGANGNGKSTLFNALYKYKRYEGNIRLYGVEIKNSTRQNISRSISYVMQEPMLYPQITVNSNLKLLDVDITSFNHFFKQFLLKPVLGKKVNQLSGGEKQEISLSIGFAKKSKCLLERIIAN